MSTENKAKCRFFAKNHFVLITVRIKSFPFVVLLPLRCISEVVEGVSDLYCLFKHKKIGPYIAMFDDILAQIRDYGPLDLADIDVKSHESHVRVCLLMR